MTDERMTSTDEIVEFIECMLCEHDDAFNDDTHPAYVGGESAVESWQTFRDAGLLTDDEGLVLSMRDGSVFHITIKRANPA